MQLFLWNRRETWKIGRYQEWNWIPHQKIWETDQFRVCSLIHRETLRIRELWILNIQQARGTWKIKWYLECYTNLNTICVTKEWMGIIIVVIRIWGIGKCQGCILVLREILEIKLLVEMHQALIKIIEIKQFQTIVTQKSPEIWEINI